MHLIYLSSKSKGPAIIFGLQCVKKIHNFFLDVTKRLSHRLKKMANYPVMPLITSILDNSQLIAKLCELGCFQTNGKKHGVIILNRSNNSCISTETSAPQQAGGFIIKYYFRISNITECR